MVDNTPAKFRRCDSVKLCNCASCGIDLLGESETPERLPPAFEPVPPPVAGRILDPRTTSMRPYCAGCLETGGKVYGRKLARAEGDDADPSQENALRVLEGD